MLLQVLKPMFNFMNNREKIKQNLGNEKYQETIYCQEDDECSEVYCMYAIFFSTQGPPIQIAAPMDRYVTGNFCRDKVLKYLKQYNSKRRPKSGIKIIRLVHHNAPSDKGGIVMEFLQQERLQYCPIPPIHQN